MPRSPGLQVRLGRDKPSCSALLGTRNRGRNPLSLDPEHREFEAKKEFGAECRDRRNQRRNKALLGDRRTSAEWTGTATDKRVGAKQEPDQPAAQPQTRHPARRRGAGRQERDM